MMAANERRLVPPEQRRSVGVFQLAFVAVVGFVLGIAVALNHSDAVRQLEASTTGTPDGFTGLLGLRTSAEPCPCAAAEGNGPRLASHPAELPARVVEQAELEQAESEQPESEQAGSEQAESEQAESEQAESEQAGSEQAESEQAESEQAESEQAGSEQTGSEQAESEQAESEQAGSEQAESEQAESEQAGSEQAGSEQAELEQAESDLAESTTSDVGLPPVAHMSGAEVAQAGMLSGLAEEVAGPAARAGALSLEAAVRAASAVGGAVIVVLATAGNLAGLHNWYASVFMAGYGLQTVFLAEDVVAYEELVARWPSRTVLVEPHKLNVAQAPRVPQYIQLLLSFNVTVVYNTVDLVWLRNPLNSARGPFDVWVAEERPSDAMSAHPSGAARAARNSSQELGLSFMVFRPTHGSRLLLNMWIVEAMGESSTNTNGLVPFNKAVWALSPRQVLVGVLSPYVFMSGYVYFSCRRYRSLRHWHNMSCESTRSDRVTVVLNNSPIDSSGANSTAAARIQRLMDNELWFVPNFEELMGLATEGMADAREDLGRSQAEREALVAKVLPGAATRHVDDGMTLAEAVEVVGGPSRTLIFCSASEGYLDFLINWFKSVQRAGQGDKVLFIAEDHVAYDFLRQRWPNQTVLVVDGPAVVEQNSSNSSDSSDSSDSSHGLAAHTFGTALYNTLVDRRPKYFEALLLLNVTFLYNDVDIVWLRDPWPLFTGNYDMWAQEDGVRPRSEAEEEMALNSSDSHEALRLAMERICTCIMLLRPTPGSLTLVRLWKSGLHILQRRAGGKPVPNQPAFNLALQLTRHDDVKVGVLPFHLFPSGFLQFSCRGYLGCSAVQRLQKRYWELKNSGTIQPVMLHNNWISGYAKKLSRFKATNLWNVTSEDIDPTHANDSVSESQVNSAPVNSVDSDTTA